jgi:flavin-dependent dehydrogenase
MSTPEPVDVLIAGAGPGGSAAAAYCARLGLSTVAVDRARFPRDKPCSEYLSPEGVRHLDLLGVLGEIEAAGNPLHGTTVVGPDGARLTGRFAEAGGTPFRGTGLSVARRTLDAALVAAARRAGAEVREGSTLTALLHEDGGVGGGVVRDGDGRLTTIRARLVIGADGLHSLVARKLGARTRGFPARVAFVAHVAEVTGLSDEAEMHVGRQGYVGLNPIGGGVANVALVVPRAVAAGAKGAAREFFYQSLERFPGVRGRVHPRHERREALVTGPFATRSTHVTAPGALLIGDAAEFFDPFTGDGILSALRGAALAAECVAAPLARQGRVTTAALAAYRAERRGLFAGKWAVERLIGWGMHAPALFDRALDRLARRDLGHTFLGVTGDILPARTVLSPSFLFRMLL